MSPPLDSVSLRAFANALEELRGAAPGWDMTVIQAQVLIAIAMDQEPTVTTLAEQLRIDQSYAVRIADLLGPEGRGTKPGAKLIRRTEVVGDRRVKPLTLSERGRRLLAGIASARLRAR
jgi:DNA-binding MarR family transcriptional regulator